jgi:Domain of unknown function DUF1828
MIDPTNLAQDLSTALNAAIEVEAVSPSEVQVHTPFRFTDGDELLIHLREAPGDGLQWSDTGHTFMHLSYWMDIDALESGNRAQLLDSHLTQFSAYESDGELLLPVNGDQLGTSLFQFVQLLLHITDLDLLSRDLVKSTFMEDFRQLMQDSFGDDAHFDYVDIERDPNRNYPIDCLLNNRPRPVAVFALSSDARCRDATITLHQFREWNRDLFSTGVFEDQEQINRKVLARFTDACDKQFSSLTGQEEAVVDYLRREWQR